MAEIELVIRIDEKYLESIHKAVEVDCTAPPYFVVRNLWKSVLNGIPLPKGHGDLIDRQAVFDNGMKKGFCEWYDEIKYANPVIEAERGENE